MAVRDLDGKARRQDFRLATFVDEHLSIVTRRTAFVHGSFVDHAEWPTTDRPRAAHAVRVIDRAGNRAVTIVHLHGLRDPQGKADTPARHAPVRPEDPLQFIDVRDLAAWLLRAALVDLPGTFNVAGERTPFGGLLDACHVPGVDTELVWIPSKQLLEGGVEPWMGVPLWIGAPGWEAATDSHRSPKKRNATSWPGSHSGTPMSDRRYHAPGTPAYKPACPRTPATGLRFIRRDGGRRRSR